MRRRKVLLTILAILLLALVGVWYFSNYHTWEYSGDGWIDEDMRAIHPTGYYVHFPVLQLSEPGEYTFRCRGLPPVPMSFDLRLVAVDPPFEPVAEGSRKYSELQTRVRFQVIDKDGGVLHSIDAPLRNWRFSPPIFGMGRRFGYFPHVGPFKFARFTEYTLKLTISDVDPASPRIAVEPALTNVLY